MKNGAGEFKGPDTANVTAAIDAAVMNPDGTLGLNFTAANAGVYPISTTSYLLVPMRMDTKKADNLIAFLNYAIGDGQGKAAALGYAPLPDRVRQAGQTAVGKINATAAQAVPVPVPAPAPAPAAEPAAPAPAPAVPAPKPARAANPAAPAPARPNAAAAAAETAPDPALANTGAGSAFAAACAGLMLLLGGLCVAAGGKRPVAGA